MLKCWKLKKEECCREFREESRQPLGSREELPECWKSTDEVKCQDFLSGVWPGGNHMEMSRSWTLGRRKWSVSISKSERLS